MNKKVFLGLFAATGMLLATSCSQDELEVPQSGNEAQVTFSLGLEGGHATRAISDGSGVDKLVYAVYKLDATSGDYELQAAVGSTNSQFVKDDFKSGDNVSIPLAKGQTYRVAFWAQNSSCDAYNTADLTAVSVDYADGDLNNDETRDAFFKTVEFTVEGSKTINVVLTRPFAQVNVGVTAEDWDAAVASGIEIEKSAVIINNAATAINLLTGEVSGEKVVSYALNAIPKETLEAETDNTKDGKEQYHWLSMSYILVNETGAQDEDRDGTWGDAQTTLDGLSYTFAPESGNNITFANGLNSVPVQRNYRTNIVGKILTGDIQFNITVDPVYDGEHIYPDGTVDDLQLAAAYGGTVILAEDVVLDDILNVTSELVVNLNGKTISGDFSDKAKTVINNTGKLTLIGGEIENTATNGAAVITNSGKLVLKDVTINGAPIGTVGYPAYAVVTSGGELTVEEGATISSDRGAIHMSNGANVTINGGNFEVTDAVGSRALTAHVIYAYGSSSKLTINGGDFAQKVANGGGTSVICPAGATIKVYGGNFYHVPVSDVQSGCFQNYMGYGAPVDVYGGTYNDNTVTKSGNLAEGYKAFQANGKWYVVAGDVDDNAIVSNDTELQAKLAAIQDGATEVVLLSGKYTMPTGSSVNLQNKTLTFKGTKETVIDVSNVDERDQFVTGATLKFEGVTLNFGTELYMGFANYASLTYKDCAINGLQFAYGSGQTVFENCDLNSNGAEHCLWTWGGQNISFTDCDFTYGDRAVNCYGQSVTTNVSFTNCTFTKVAGKPTTGAIETNSSTLTALYLTINNCTVNEGDLWWISTWDSKNGANTFATVDGKIATSAAMLAAIKNGATEVELSSGEYTMPIGSDVNLQNKTLTIKGTKETVIDVSNVDERDQFVTGATLKFEGVTLNFGTALYMGFANTNELTYKDCIINGVQHLFGPKVNFDGCTLNVAGDNYMVRTWGGKNVNFSNCTFNCDGKALLVYNQSCDLTITNCVFNDNGDGTISGKAAIEVCNGDNGANCVTHNIIINNTTVNGFDINTAGINTNSTLWANKNSLDDAHLNVTIDGTVVY